MSEELLKAIIKLFAIVAKERITEDERNNIREFLSVHLNQEGIDYYIQLFEEFIHEETSSSADIQHVDVDTKEFIHEWSKIIEISKQINEGLSQQQKAVLMIKIIELLWADREISERQSNLIFYIGKAIKIEKKDIDAVKTFVTADDVEELDSGNFLIIDEGSDDHTYQSKHLVAKNLTGFIAIMRWQEIESYFIKYIGISSLTLNGLPLKSRKISVFPTGSTIRGNKVDPIFYSDVVSKFIYSEVETNISFIAENVTFRFKSGDIGIRNINVAEEGGRLIGIMGASGSGKSTLLNVLNGNEEPTVGRVTINKVDVHREKERMAGLIGYVPQDDFLIEELTVFQNLYYAAKLSFSDYSDDDVEKLVSKTLRSLGLLETKDLKVGSPLDKVISGGQRKRLNIGLELLREPNIMFLDEPTSGLSSRDSENVMDLLKELSLRGKLIFVVIHQPSSDIFKMFDNLLILDVGGYQIYYGNPIEAVTYFRNIMNLANRDQGACMECGNVRVEQIFNIIETKTVNEFGRFTDQRKISAAEWNKYFKKYLKIPKIEPVKEALVSTINLPGRLKQIEIFSLRDSTAKLSNKQYMVINMLEAPLLAIFLAYITRYYERTEEYAFFDNVNIPVYFFMSIVIALFMGLTVSAEEIIRDRKILKREAFLNLSWSSYLESKVLILFLISAIQTFLFVLIGDFILEIKGMLLRYWMILFSASCFANLLGLNISSAFKSAVTIYILIPLLLIPQLILSGVVISFDKLNPQITTEDEVPVLGDIIASRWAFEAAIVTQFKDNRFEEKFYDLNQQIYSSEYKIVYYIPILESNLEANFKYLRDTSEYSEDEIRENFALLRNEIGKELKLVGSEQLPVYNQLNIQDFDSALYYKTGEFLDALRQFYQNRYSKATEKKDSIVQTMTDTPQEFEQFQTMKRKYKNKTVEDLVYNKTTAERILEKNGRLIQKVYPIYYDPRHPEHPLDFRTKFFAPKKYFFGLYLDTLYFNLGVIWAMTLFLFITLYLELLRKAVAFFGREKV